MLYCQCDPCCPSVLWHCWLGYVASKNRRRNDLFCVTGWDIKPYSSREALFKFAENVLCNDGKWCKPWHQSAAALHSADSVHLMPRIIQRQRQGPSLARERSQLLDLASGTLSLKISIPPPTSTVLNVTSRLIIIAFTVIPLGFFYSNLNVVFIMCGHSRSY